MKNLFEHKSYKKYLLDRWGQRGSRSGQRLKASKFLGCQTAYLSQVLNGTANLSLEQAHNINSFMDHDQEESKFFLLLVQIERAGTVDLKKFFLKEIKEILNRRTVLKNRLKDSEELSEEHKNTYYSSWIYIAVHTLLSVPNFQTKQKLCQHLRASNDQISNVLNFLMSGGLVSQEGDRFVPVPKHIHLANDQANILKHHTNWRLQAMKDLDNQNSDNLHYSVVYSLSNKDAKKIQDRMIDLIKANLKTVAASNEELVYCHSMDFFEI